MTLTEVRGEQIADLVALIGKKLSPILLEQRCPALLDVVRESLYGAGSSLDATLPRALEHVLRSVADATRIEALHAFESGSLGDTVLFNRAAFAELLVPSEDATTRYLGKVRSRDHIAENAIKLGDTVSGRQLRASLWLRDTPSERTVYRRSRWKGGEPEPILAAAMLDALHEYLEYDEKITALRKRFGLTDPKDAVIVRQAPEIAGHGGVSVVNSSGHGGLREERRADGRPLWFIWSRLRHRVSVAKVRFEQTGDRTAHRALLFCTVFALNIFCLVLAASFPSTTMETLRLKLSFAHYSGVAFLIVVGGCALALAVRRLRRKEITGRKALSLFVQAFNITAFVLAATYVFQADRIDKKTPHILAMPDGDRHTFGAKWMDGQYRRDILAQSSSWPLVADGFDENYCMAESVGNAPGNRTCEAGQDSLRIVARSAAGVALTEYGGFKVGSGEFYFEVVFDSRNRDSLTACGLRASVANENLFLHLRAERLRIVERPDPMFGVDALRAKSYKFDLLAYRPELLEITKSGEHRDAIQLTPTSIEGEVRLDINRSPLVRLDRDYSNSTKLAVFGTDDKLIYFINDREAMRSERSDGEISLGVGTAIGGSDRGGVATCTYRSLEARASEG
ncbi:hypothetical protein [Micromonospora sp. NBC_01796]|uniref:hypothetical protein n=1 Tax=Micromonospora sp. NBC_01796 TaxID=2975987 RepID=UPI002DDB18A8|nr:hypothetical protein [Micromonospora sp. NBC_01796]WSA86708.1 hypothetical protein OIE47_03520 [Micromonospora sp. NBC_01796]